MSHLPAIGINKATVLQIETHLQACDNAFTPPLRERVDIGEYARKIADKAQRFEAWWGGELIGLVAAYCNESEKQTAFITNVSVLPSWRTHGIASRLAAECIDYVARIGFTRIELKADSRNPVVGHLYARLGFTVASSRGQITNMYLDLV